MMDNPAGESKDANLRLDFDRHLKLEFHGSRIIFDGGLFVDWEIENALGLSAMADDKLADARAGRNGHHALAGDP